MTWRFDFHVHSAHSADAKGSVLDLAVAAQEAGLHGFCLTDHDTTTGHAEIDAAMQATGLLIVPGIEVTSAEGHVLAVGVHEAVPRGQGFPETVAAIEAQGGIAVPAHPLRLFSGMGPTLLRLRAEEGHVHAVEGHNARERRLVAHNTQRLVRGLDLPMLAGSDAHWVHDIGTAYTVFDAAPKDAAELIGLVRDGLCRPAGAQSPRRKVWGHGVSLAMPKRWRGRRKSA